MSSNARASGMPSSSAGKEVGDIVQTPDAPIKSWRYLGGGKWEPNDVVRFTETGPGGGVELVVGGQSITINPGAAPSAAGVQRVKDTLAFGSAQGPAQAARQDGKRKRNV